MKKSMVILAVAFLAAAGWASAQQTESVFSNQTGTIQPTGPRPPANGDRFINIEGSNNGAFASYGVLRWDVSGAKANFDASFGAGNWTVTKIELALTQDNAAFTTDGFLDILFTEDDVTDAKTAASPLQYPFNDPNPAGDLQPNVLVVGYIFIEGTTGQVDVIELFNGGTQGAEVAADIEGDSTVTIVLNDADPAVAATYRGQEEFQGRKPPELRITAQQGGGGGCTGNEKLNSAKCKAVGKPLVLKTTGGTPGETVTGTAGSKSATKTIKANGSAKIKLKGVDPSGTATATWQCGATKSTAYSGC